MTEQKKIEILNKMRELAFEHSSIMQLKGIWDGGYLTDDEIAILNNFVKQQIIKKRKKVIAELLNSEK